MPMAIGFIFMATRRDRTVPQARALIDEALTLGVANIGFKDIGLPRAALKELARAIRAGGARAFFEVVSLDRDSELASAAAAVDFGVDWLLGGVRASEVAPIAKSAGALYAPFPGRCRRPSQRARRRDRGDRSERAGARRARGRRRPRPLGLSPFGRRSALIRAVVGAVDKPVIVAGSIDDAERIATVAASGAAGFTIGSAAIEGAFPAPSQRFSAQIRAIQRAVADLG